jgi:hypothetical protein
MEIRMEGKGRRGGEGGERRGEEEMGEEGH